MPNPLSKPLQPVQDTSASSDPAQLSCVQQQKRCRGSHGQSPSPLFFRLCSSLVPQSWSHGVQGGFAEKVWQEQHLPLVRRTVQSVAADTHLLGLGLLRLSAEGRATARSFQRSRQVESHWNHCSQGKKECVLTKAQNPWVCLVLLLLSSHCCFLIHHRQPFLLDQVSAFSSFNSLVNHSMCLPIMMPVFITPIWERKHAWEKQKSKDYKYIFLAFCT